MQLATRSLNVPLNYLQPPGDQLLQTGGKNEVIPVEVEVNTNWIIHPLSCEEPYAKVAQLEEKLEDI